MCHLKFASALSRKHGWKYPQRTLRTEEEGFRSKLDCVIQARGVHILNGILYNCSKETCEIKKIRCLYFFHYLHKYGVLKLSTDFVRTLYIWATWIWRFPVKTLTVPKTLAEWSCDTGHIQGVKFNTGFMFTFARPCSHLAIGCLNWSIPILEALSHLRTNTQTPLKIVLYVLQVGTGIGTYCIFLFLKSKTVIPLTTATNLSINRVSSHERS